MILSLLYLNLCGCLNLSTILTDKPSPVQKYCTQACECFLLEYYFKILIKTFSSWLRYFKTRQFKSKMPLSGRRLIFQCWAILSWVMESWELFSEYIWRNRRVVIAQPLKISDWWLYSQNYLNSVMSCLIIVDIQWRVNMGL